MSNYGSYNRGGFGQVGAGAGAYGFGQSAAAAAGYGQAGGQYGQAGAGQYAGAFGGYGLGGQGQYGAAPQYGQAAANPYAGYGQAATQGYPSPFANGASSGYNSGASSGYGGSASSGQPGGGYRSGGGNGNGGGGGTAISADRQQRSVFVGNIPYKATESELIQIFSQAGSVVAFRLVNDRDTGRPKGFGFCEYSDAAGATTALEMLNGTELHGRPLRVGSSK